MSDFDFSDINLDFLQSTPPKNSTSVKRIPTPVHNESRTKRRIEWAKKVANVDQLLKEIQKLKCENQQLQNQLKDFQKSALDIQDLYTTEKRNHVAKAKALEELQRKYDKADTELVVKSLKCDQLQACLSNEKERPLDYNDLVVKYLKLVHKFDSEDGVRGYHDRSIIEDLKQYCAKFKLKIHIPAGTKSKTQKLSKEDASIQCELLLDTPIITKPERKCQSTQCQVELCNQETQHNDTTSRSTISKTQSTQCHVELRSQGTQHISTMTTRSTTTSCFIKFRSVGTNFPEIHSQPAVDDILKEFAPWQNITPISPLIDQLNEEVRKSYKTIGTCTWLCNIRRPIDFIPRNKMKRLPSSRPGSCDVSAQGTIIKQEVPTPSPSPTPNAPANQTRTNSNTAAVNSSDSTASNTTISSQNIATVNQLIDTLNATSQLSQVSNPSFQDLWHIFGIGIGMVLGLLRTTNNGNSSNAGVAANSAMHHDSVNQQQFHNWLRELYDSSVAASSATASQTRSVETAPLNNQNYMEHGKFSVDCFFF